MKVYDITKEDWVRIDNTYTYHSPNEEQPERYKLLRDNAESYGHTAIEVRE